MDVIMARCHPNTIYRPAKQRLIMAEQTYGLSFPQQWRIKMKLAESFLRMGAAFQMPHHILMTEAFFQPLR